MTAKTDPTHSVWQHRRRPDDHGLWAGVFAGSKGGPNLEDCHMPTTTTPHVRFRTVDGVRIRYARQRYLAQAEGRPNQSVAGEHLPVQADVGSLSEHARLFAVDLPGFGASERREDLLSPRAMGEFLAQLIAEADLGAPHIVAPDVGTAAAAWGGEADG